MTKVNLEKNYIPAAVACRVVGCSAQTLRDWARKGKLDHIKTPGGQYRYNLEAFFQGQEQNFNDN